MWKHLVWAVFISVCLDVWFALEIPRVDLMGYDVAKPAPFITQASPTLTTPTSGRTASTASTATTIITYGGGGGAFSYGAGGPHTLQVPAVQCP